MIAKASFIGKDPNRIGVSILHDHDFCHGRISWRAGDAQSDEVSGSARSPNSYLTIWIAQRVTGAEVMRSSPVSRIVPVISASAAS
jgi:hypothetical protein